MDMNNHNPFRLNFNNLDAVTQEKLMQRSQDEVEQKSGTEMKAYAMENHLDYNELLEEEAIKNGYNHTFKFTI